MEIEDEVLAVSRNEHATQRDRAKGLERRARCPWESRLTQCSTTSLNRHILTPVLADSSAPERAGTGNPRPAPARVQSRGQVLKLRERRALLGAPTRSGLTARELCKERRGQRSRVLAGSTGTTTFRVDTLPVPAAVLARCSPGNPYGHVR